MNLSILIGSFLIGLDFTIRTVYMETINSRVFFFGGGGGGVSIDRERHMKNYLRTLLGKIGLRSF